MNDTLQEAGVAVDRLSVSSGQSSPGKAAAGSKAGVSADRIYGFDYLRVFFMVSVIIGHANLVKGWADDLATATGQGPNFWDYFYFHLQSCAVPAFVLVSMILFLRKTPTWERTKARLATLGYLYGFWVGAWVLYTKAKPENPGLPGVVEFLLRGGNWVFYFIAVLIICTLLGWVAGNLSRRGRWAGLLLSSAVLALTYWWLLQDRRWTVSHYYWLPTCFTMMPFVAALMVPHLEALRASRSLRWKWIGLFLVLTVAAALLEWHYSLPGDAVDIERRWIPKHARFSIQFGAIVIVCLALGVRRHPSDIGAYVSALTHYATLFKKSPVGLPAQGISADFQTDVPVSFPPDVATKLQQIVWSVVSNYPNSGVTATLTPVTPPSTPVYVHHNPAAADPTLLAYAFGPTGSDGAAPAANLPRCSVGAAGTQVLECTLNADAESAGVTYAVEWSTDLVNWTNQLPTGTAVERIGQKWRVTLPASGSTQKRFMRVYVQRSAS